MNVTFINEVVKRSTPPWYTDITMDAKRNVRKLVREGIVGALRVALAEQTDMASAEVVADATNPYAFVVNVEGKRFRVVVKEVE